MSILAILVSALVSFIIGFLFHGPLFGKTWMRLAKITPTGNEKLSDMKWQMFWNYFVNVVCAVFINGAIWIVGATSMFGDITWYKGAIIALWLGVGFTIPWTSIDVIWMGKSWKLWLFDTASFLLCMMSMGAILAVWR